MPLFVLSCIDRPGALAARMAARDAHLAYLRDSGQLKLGGPYLDEGGQMTGSLLIIEAADLQAARAFSAADPYVQADVFQSVDIRPFRATIGSL